MSSVCLSVCPSLCLSVTLVDCDHIGWNSSKIISPLVSMGCSLFATPTWRVCSKGNTLNLGPKWPTPCWFERRRNSIANCGRIVTDSATVTTRKPSYRWEIRATRKRAKNCSNSTCLQRCRRQYWPIFIRLAVVESEICEIPRKSLKIQTYRVQGHPRSSILVSIESPCTTSY